MHHEKGSCIHHREGPRREGPHIHHREAPPVHEEGSHPPWRRTTRPPGRTCVHHEEGPHIHHMRADPEHAKCHGRPHSVPSLGKDITRGDGEQQIHFSQSPAHRSRYIQSGSKRKGRGTLRDRPGCPRSPPPVPGLPRLQVSSSSCPGLLLPLPYSERRLSRCHPHWHGSLTLKV